MVQGVKLQTWLILLLQSPKKFLLLFHYRGHSMYSPFQQASGNARGMNRDWGWHRSTQRAWLGPQELLSSARLADSDSSHHQGPSSNTQGPQPAGSVPAGLHHMVKHSHSGRRCLSRWEKWNLVSTGTRSEAMTFTVFFSRALLTSVTSLAGWLLSVTPNTGKKSRILT